MVLDLERVRADHVAGADVLDHGGDHMGSEGRGIDLAEAFDAVVGGELQEDEIASAEMGRRVADHVGFDVGDLHGASPSGGGTCRVTRGLDRIAEGRKG